MQRMIIVDFLFIISQIIKSLIQIIVVSETVKGIF